VASPRSRRNWSGGTEVAHSAWPSDGTSEVYKAPAEVATKMPEPHSRLKLGGSGRDHRPLCAALATWAPPQDRTPAAAPPAQRLLRGHWVQIQPHDPAAQLMLGLLVRCALEEAIAEALSEDMVAEGGRR
jgi:hypothetical protein